MAVVNAVLESRSAKSGPSEEIGLRIPLVLTLLWLGTGVILNMAWTWFYQAMWIMQLIPIGAHFLWGVVQTSSFGFIAFQRPRLWLLAGPMALGLAGFWFGAGLLGQWGDRAAFAVLRPGYDRVVAAVARGPIGEPAYVGTRGGRHSGVRFTYRPETPGLIAFNWVDGIPDGGSAIIYDASDAALGTVKEDEGIGRAIGDLVNGHVRGCSQFAKPHYLMCHFS